MDRRRLLFMSLAGLAATPAFAQTGTAPPSMGEAERKHIRDTLQVGSMSLDISKIAQQHANMAKVKEFANFEVAEQETIGGILKPLLGGAAPVDPMQADLVKKLNGAGTQFDLDYVDAEITGHNKLLEIQNTYLSAGKNPSQIDIAKLARTMITEHLTLLADLQKTGMRG